MSEKKKKLHKNMCRGFPGDPVVKPAFTAVDLGLIPSDQGTKIPQATWSGTKRKKKACTMISFAKRTKTQLQTHLYYCIYNTGKNLGR